MKSLYYFIISICISQSSFANVLYSSDVNIDSLKVVNTKTNTYKYFGDYANHLVNGGTQFVVNRNSPVLSTKTDRKNWNYTMPVYLWNEQCQLTGDRKNFEPFSDLVANDSYSLIDVMPITESEFELYLINSKRVNQSSRKLLIYCNFSAVNSISMLESALEGLFRIVP